MIIRINKKTRAIVLGMSLAVLLAGCGKKQEDVPAGESDLSTGHLAQNANSDEEAPGIHVVLQVTEPERVVFQIGDASCSPGQARLYLSNMAQNYQAVYGRSIMGRVSEGVSFGQQLKNSALLSLQQSLA